ncbi:hypothetical protein HDU81_007742 [Chytriomyces hyalinus]|nr:hypothetical protein HDU81_007742 [Chytriomyces hyalinus]
MDTVKAKSSGRIVKRGVQRRATLATDVFVSRKSSFPALLKRCAALRAKDGFSSFSIHGLGAAVAKAVSLALAFKDLNDDIDFDISTSTVNLIDDVIEEDDEDKEDSVNERKNSAIHIRVFAKAS